jgi:probable Rubsico expression protein CbbX
MNMEIGAAVPANVDLARRLAESDIEATLDRRDRALVGVVPAKTRIREVAARPLVERARRMMGLETDPPSLHVCFTAHTGTTTVARRMAQILHRLGYVRREEVASVTRDDLGGRYIGHTAPKTKEVIKKAMGGGVFVDAAYDLRQPENERDHGQEAIEILLQVIEDARDDLVVILDSDPNRMDTFLQSNPGMGARIAHHLAYPDYSAEERCRIAALMVATVHYRFGAAAIRDSVRRRMAQRCFANARSIRNVRLRQANRLFAARATDPTDRTALQTIRASRVFRQ